jgi:hypothetical protein
MDRKIAVRAAISSVDGMRTASKCVRPGGDAVVHSPLHPSKKVAKEYPPLWSDARSHSAGSPPPKAFLGLGQKDLPRRASVEPR